MSIRNSAGKGAILLSSHCLSFVWALLDGARITRFSFDLVLLGCRSSIESVHGSENGVLVRLACFDFVFFAKAQNSVALFSLNNLLLVLLEGTRRILFLDSCEEGTTLHFLSYLAFALGIDQLLGGQLNSLTVHNLRNDLSLWLIKA